MSAKKVSIVIDRETRETTPGLIPSQSLITLAGITGAEQLLLEVVDDIDIPIGLHDWLLIRGGEKFSIGSGEHPIEDNPCLRKPIRFHFNGHLIPEEQALQYPKVTGADLKHLDPNSQPSDGLFADLEDLADEPIRDDQRIIVQRRDRFITTPCGNVGFTEIVVQHLQQVQEVFPAAVLMTDGGNQYVLVPHFSLPSFWSEPSVDLLISIPNGYPMAAPDMFWIAPFIRLSDGRDPGGGNNIEQHVGRSWQRFSWHYTGAGTSWQPARSSLLTHVQFCKARLQQQM